MSRHFYLTAAFVLAFSAVWAQTGINYDGNTLELNTRFIRSECGTAYKNVMKEVSGMAASRQTPGYLWMHGDENMDENRKIVAVQPSGTLAMTVNVSTPGSSRDDWEDIATGVYNGQNYVFIGAIGDNDCAYADNYYIYYFEEPAISSGTVSVTAQAIRFGYPNGTAYNTETLMYDNIEQCFYIANKTDGVSTLYKLPFQPGSGSGVQRLTAVCSLGNGSVFNTLTGGDISPDGQWMAIRSEDYILLWERQNGESLSVTASRRPQQVSAYQKEKQGESIAWADSTTFYTTSDQKKDVPIYQYTHAEEETPPQAMEAQIYEVIMTNMYSAFIPAGEQVIHAYYLAGTAVPEVGSYIVSTGTEWSQEGNVITITGAYGDTKTYTLSVEAVTPLEYTPDEIVFDGSEDESTWLKGQYGFLSDKKWRFSKTDTDYSREIEGKTHIELFLPACDTVVVTSMSKERAVRFSVNGVPFGDKVTLSTSGTALAVAQEAPFMLTLASAQSSGDGGIAAIRLARRPGETTGTGAVLQPDAAARKILLDGQLYILRGGQVYTAEGKITR